MKITRVTATPLDIPARVQMAGVDKTTSLSVCLVEIETDTGLVGHGFTAITEEEVITAVVREIAGPALIGEDPLATEHLWDKLYWLLSPRGQTGYASHAIAALDIALWDIKGKALGLPVWKLLGGARDTVPVYTTFGFAVFDREQLAEAARHWVAQGHKRLKMVVGHHALQRRDEPRPLAGVIAEDARRVRAVRDAVGPDVQLYIDANCSLDLLHAQTLARSIADCDVTFFEEPVTQNDVRQMAELRRSTGMRVAAGQNEGLAFRFRDMLLAGAVDVLQPNVVISGGYTQCTKIAGMAAAFNTPIANGGAWPHHNMHLHGGLANGGLVEYHYVAVLVCEQIFEGLAKPVDGALRLPDTPGLGFTPRADAIAELAKRPTSHGKGKA
jgi:L-alanine-DL-glutamate epimerase-like enolase superfamily enzyme